MNERIRELWIKAAESTAAYPGGQNNSWETQVNFLDKFALLIVQECMACSTWVGKINTNSVEPIHTSHAINQRIKQQFGVEE
jgi:hypothetical protein